MLNRSPSRQPSVMGSVDVFGDPKEVLSDWRSLTDVASAPPYTMPDWLVPWLDAIGRPSGIEPAIVLARNQEGRAVALLPLGLRRRGPLTVASFLGGRDSNFNMGLFSPTLSWNREAIRDLLRRAAAARGIDVFAFRNQPHAWQGVPNPLLALAHQPSPSFAYKASLQADPDAFFQSHLSREGRKKLRQKMNRLRGLGPVSFITARSADEAAEILDAFMTQRMARHAAAGLASHGFDALRRFLDLTVGGAGPVEFHALRCGDQVVATLGGTRRRDRFSGMLTSFTIEGEFGRTSPGELLLSEVIRHCCEAGLTSFDLGIGEARYKETYCPEVEPLFDSVVPVTAIGHVGAAGEAMRLRLKRAIKQSPRMWSLVLKLRRTRGSLVRSAEPRDP